MDCPFKVGDRIHELRAEPVFHIATLTADGRLLQPAPGAMVLEPDPSRPDATVTEITARGFRYEYSLPITIGRAAWGHTSIGGECFAGGFYLWALARPADKGDTLSRETS